LGIVGFLVAALTAVALITSSAQAHPSRASPPQGKIVFEQFIDDQTGSAL